MHFNLILILILLITLSSTVKADTYNGPCNGGGGACIDVDNTSCSTKIVTGKCQGGNNVRCCVAGSKPAWYINQGQHTETFCILNGEKKIYSIFWVWCRKSLYVY